MTDTSTTIPSLVTAINSIKINGSVIVSSYPNSNLNEHVCVKELADYVGRIGGKNTRDAEDKVYEIDGWKSYRVFNTEGIGREHSPQLITFTRIK
jgi:hypothetical protein